MHLNPLVVTIALMFWGMLWGALGLLLAIPLTAAHQIAVRSYPYAAALRALAGRLIVGIHDE